MRSARGIRAASTPGHTFTMPAYTSHTTRQSPTKTSGKTPTSQQHPFTSSSSSNHSHPTAASYSESDQNLLAMLTSTVACLKEKHMDLEALGCLEQSLWLKRRMFGAESPAVRRALHDVVLSYNSLAMQFLARAQFDQSLSMLRKAEAITSPPGNFPHCQSLQILTFNNIGCCYRKLGKLKSALKYLQEAAAVGAGAAHVKNLSITHLNLCAIQSQLGRHDLALEHAQAAIFHTQQELVDMDQPVSSAAGEEASEDVLDAKSKEEKIVSLAVAYHNLAVELEFNGRGEASLQWYKKALQLVAKYQASNHALYESFIKIFHDAKKKYEANEKPQWNQRPKSAANARPKSAHPSSRVGGGSDMSYSATVASQCYKPTKPSTAGLQYARGTAASPTKDRVGTRPYTHQQLLQNPTVQRPSSANSSRRRPLSASTRQRQSVGVSVRGRGRETEADQASELADSVEARWHQIEQELFGGDHHHQQQSNRHDQEEIAPRSSRLTRPTSAHARRPQSARVIDKDAGRASSGRRVLSSTHCSTKRDEIDLQDEDDECGIINDDEEEEDGEDGENAVDPAFRELPRRPAAASARHRQVLHESRSRQSIKESDDPSGYGGSADSSHGDEEVDDLSSNGELPTQRVNHLEYVRRMKKLAESIQEDVEASRGSGKPSKQRAVTEDEYEPQMKAAEPPRRASDSVPSSDKQTTPRSASATKLRERVELVRRESVGVHEESTEAMLQSEDQQDAVDQPAREVVVEDTYVFASDVAVLSMEKRLLREAAVRHIQSTGRGHVARRQVRQRRLRREQEDAACVIQHRARQFANEAAVRREIEEKQTAVENQAASVIQGVFRRNHQQNSDRNHEEEEEGREEKALSQVKDAIHKFHDVKDPQHDADNGDAATEDEDDEAYTPMSSARMEQADSRSSSLASTPSTTAPSTAPSTSRSTYESPPSTLRESSPPLFSTGTPRPTDSIRDTAARTIQCAFRRQRVSQSVDARGLARRLSRSYIEHHHFDLVLTAARSHEQAFLEALSAVKIQSLVRGHQTRILYDAERIGRHAAAATIQHRFRRFFARRQRQAAHGVLTLAARCIQRRYRAYTSRQASQRQCEMEIEMMDVYHLAASTIQQCWREWWRARNDKIAQWEAATCIQALGRGHLTRKSYTSLKESASKASAFSIQLSERTEDDEDAYDHDFDEDP